MPTSRQNVLNREGIANFAYGEAGDSQDVLALVAPTIVSTSLTKVRVVRVTNREEKYPKASFGLAADMREVGRSGNNLKLRFSIAVETNPLVQRAQLEGKVEVRLDPALLAATGGQLGEDFASDLALEIYKRHYETIYSLFDSLALESPSPWLLRDVHLVQ